MKKVLAVLLIGFSLAGFCFAEDKQDTGKSEYEKVLLQKGSLLIKEFEKFQTLKYGSGYSDDIDGEICTLTDAQTNQKIYALRMSHFYYSSKYDSGTSTGVLDAAEIASVVSTLNYVKNEFDKLDAVSSYKEMVYTCNGGLSLGAYQSGNEKKLFIKFDYKDTTRIDFAKIDDLINFFSEAQNKIDQKMKK